jgi:hypothetical protein
VVVSTAEEVVVSTAEEVAVSMAAVVAVGVKGGKGAESYFRKMALAGAASPLKTLSGRQTS